MANLRREDMGATVRGLSAALGRPAHTIQTSLCEYDKYVRWYNNPGEMRLRRAKK